MWNKNFTVTAEYVSYQIRNIERAIAGTRSDLANLTAPMQITAHVEQIKQLEKKLAAKKARLAEMTN